MLAILQKAMRAEQDYRQHESQLHCSTAFKKGKRLASMRSPKSSGCWPAAGARAAANAWLSSAVSAAASSGASAGYSWPEATSSEASWPGSSVTNSVSVCGPCREAKALNS